MIGVSDALKLVLETAKSLGVESVALEKCIGRTLAEDIFADRPVPPFDRVTMDGIAIAYRSGIDENIPFPIEGVGPAGAPRLTLNDPKNCIEIMTGASLPVDADTVVRYEDLEKRNGAYHILSEVRQGQNVHLTGSDHGTDAVLLQKGIELKAIDVNILASVGKTHVDVLKLPKVAMISSGDELVEVAEVPESYQIRKSNVYMIASRLKQLGIESGLFHFKDDSDLIFEKMEAIQNDFDVLLMSGGVSKGKFDFIPEVLDRLGYKKIFHKVAQRPGKPFWFGVNGSKVVFAFPGNPVSTLSCFHKYFLPWLYQSVGKQYQQLKVVLDEDVAFKPNLTYFAQAALTQKEDGLFYAKVRHGRGSGDIVSPSMMDGFLELEAGKDVYEKGEMHPFMPFYPLFR